MSFWPIASWIESPGFQRRSTCQLHGSVFLVKVACFQAIVGSRPDGRGADVEARLLAEAERLGPALERLAAVGRQVVERLAHLVEVRVARLGDRGRQRHRRVHERVPVLEDLARDLVRARAGQRVVRREDVLLHRGQRGHRLERRARRIRARDRAVEGRIVVRFGHVRVRQGSEGALLAARPHASDRRSGTRRGPGSLRPAGRGRRSRPPSRTTGGLPGRG